MAKLSQTSSNKLSSEVVVKHEYNSDSLTWHPFFEPIVNFQALVSGLNYKALKILKKTQFRHLEPPSHTTMPYTLVSEYE